MQLTEQAMKGLKLTQRQEKTIIPTCIPQSFSVSCQTSFHSVGGCLMISQQCVYVGGVCNARHVPWGLNSCLRVKPSWTSQHSHNHAISDPGIELADVTVAQQNILADSELHVGVCWLFFWGEAIRATHMDTHPLTAAFFLDYLM